MLSIGEIETGIKAMLSPHVERGQSASCAVIAVAKKIVSSAPPRSAPTPARRICTPSLHPLHPRLVPCPHHGTRLGTVTARIRPLQVPSCQPQPKPKPPHTQLGA